MREIDKYGALKEKLSGICDENNLKFTIHNQGYPFKMVIKPLSGLDAQQTMMEGMDDRTDTGYISQDAALVFAFRDGDLTYKISETWTISESLFNKLKNIFKKMHGLWMQYFYRDVHENSPSAIPDASNGAGAEAADGSEEAEDPDFIAEEDGDTVEEVTLEEIDAEEVAEAAVDPFEGFMDDEDEAHDASGLTDE